MIMSIIVSFMGAIGTFALVIPPGINLVAVFLMAFPSGYVSTKPQALLFNSVSN
jgi:hypothetical protein